MKKQIQNLSKSSKEQKKLVNKGFKIHLEKNKNKNVQYYIGIAFILLGSTSLLSDISNIMSWYIVFGVLYLVSPKLSEKYNYSLFTEEGLLQPRYFNLAKPKFLAYQDITFIAYIVGDYVFRNSEVEFRFPKELLNQKEIDFLEEQMQVLKKDLN